MGQLDHLFTQNREWAAAIRAEDPDFFLKLSQQQSPEYLWIGCSDSRVPANEIVEPTIAEIHAGLKTHGHVNEAEWWQVALRDSAKFRRTGKLSSNA